MNVKLTKLTPSMEKEFMEYINELKSINERIIPSTIDPSDKSYLELLEKLKEFEDDETCPSHLVPSTCYVLVNDNGRVLGSVDIRHHIEHENLKTFGGHIGYGVRPSERNKGYAKEQLHLALIEAKKMGLKKVLITCNIDNLYSEKTIRANGGIFESEYKENGHNVKRFWIEL